ncbi:unnamed protein product [Rotaria magnacalcarata]|uniref:Uncharacterized protein n=1 Tax=Rotaria magnacalcarata TaxID=392030 RepID=A0A817AJR5_9BILA|nr:unnamed protein product [Rotaria magnacalcarata]CAF1684380.1 unnamed protein product [Rotaria magnacalcarata]CAF2262526.1 unnamed protein product [Rotaria magnacalcarata]CAF3819744.1 unnamed protein product [Rotaria magnacalcarata]CAF4102704.1 unnamed protein product [Rotaria magnacalcarata]
MPHPFPKVQSFFLRKDPSPRQLLSNVVYNVPCDDCSVSYIAASQCSQKAIPIVVSTITTTTTTTEKVEPHRTKRNKPIVDYAMNEKLFDLAIKEPTPAKKVIRSAVHDNEIETGHSIGCNELKINSDLSLLKPNTND